MPGPGSVARATTIPAGIQLWAPQAVTAMGSTSRVSSEVAGPAGCQGRVTVPTRCLRDGGRPRCHPTGAAVGWHHWDGAEEPYRARSHWWGTPEHCSVTVPKSERSTGLRVCTTWAPSFPSSSPQPPQYLISQSQACPHHPRPKAESWTKPPSAEITAPITSTFINQHGLTLLQPLLSLRKAGGFINSLGSRDPSFLPPFLPDP